MHLCSTGYAEQYAASFMGHLGPVYAVAWSPFRPGLFLTASADWTLRLWSEAQAGATSFLSPPLPLHRCNSVSSP